GLKAMSPTAAAVARTPTVSKKSLRLKAWSWLDAQSTITGAMTSAPVTSPSHHVTQAFAKLARSMYPAVARLVSPMLVLIGVAIMKQIRANFATEFGVKNVLHPLDHRLIRW